MNDSALQLTWYFDYISPFAYLQSQQLHELPDHVTVTYKPVVFAGLLKYWGQLGPAEIPHKRVYMYRFVQWLAARHGIDYRTPPVHPFNPLPALRLSLVLNNTPEAVNTIFRAVWVDGVRTDEAEPFAELAARLGVANVTERIGEARIKDALRRNTDEAIVQGVFGVPTFRFRDQLFWGHDSFDFLLDCLANPKLLETDEMRRAATVPTGVVRKR